jgi:hypothetical protein
VLMMMTTEKESKKTMGLKSEGLWKCFKCLLYLFRQRLFNNQYVVRTQQLQDRDNVHHDFAAYTMLMNQQP